MTKLLKLYLYMYKFGFRLQLLILELRKNIRYWVMALPIITLLIVPLAYSLGAFGYSYTLDKSTGLFSTLVPKKEDVQIIIDQEKFIDLKSGKRMFFSRVNNRDNVKFGFRKIYYKIQFFDANNNEIDKDDTRYENFILPKEVFYLTHYASSKATKMKINFLTKESDIVNIIPTDLVKFDKKVVEVSNLAIDTSRDDFFNLNYLLNNVSSKTLNNIKFHYILTNKSQEIVYTGSIQVSQLTDNDKSIKSVNDLSYPLNTPKLDLEFTSDNNRLRYNYLQYEI